ncbi:carbohydrate ABC transporter permease [Clostridium thermosuccinogenes]|jgi:multiple sugar transport system permease protein|nr:carbohydrate ABC transporter permease [Pseudoclostridium thermosuccinogenes]PNT90548.1 hypothetical protein CDQ83_18025 [Pseudoclostridium thermosuccinogenes]
MRLNISALIDRHRMDRYINKAKKALLGSREKTGILFTIFVYTMLISLGFIYLYPMLHMFVTSFMSLDDLLDESVRWIPTHISLENYIEAFRVMKFKTTIGPTILLTVIPSLCQTVVCAVTGYGFARYRFKGKSIILVLVLLTFVIPPHVMMVPRYLMYTDYKMIGSIGVLLYPAILGQGLNSAIFILIFTQFFRQTPVSLDEAARVDGAGELRIFLTIAVPLAVPAFIVSILFSSVWYWNETYFSSLYLGSSNIGNQNTVTTILMELSRFEDSYKKYVQQVAGYWGAGGSVESIANEAIRMAGTMISILPLLIVYFLLQKHFVESIERTGITGE